MQGELQTLIADVLKLPPDAVYYELSRRLRTAFPDMALLETEGHAFRVDIFAAGEQCELAEKAGFHSQYQQFYKEDDDDTASGQYNFWGTAKWKGHEFELLVIGLRNIHSRDQRSFLLGPSHALVREFFEAVCHWNTEVRGEVLVFSGGCWSKDADLFEAIKTSTLDGLILEGDLKTSIRNDFLAFFDSEATYTKYGIAWKRGVLFLGPPGNGKTHAIKGLVNLLDRPCLYIKTFESEYGTQQGNIHSVFEKARALAPCVLVLEDLDSLLNDGNRAFFLNEMDGFAENRGILTVATTNHPERLDPAILERPSRFDRKYTFNLPTLDTRRQFLGLRNQALEQELRLSESALERIAGESDGFSYAYLKELFLSAMMDWIAAPGEKPLVDSMSAQIETLLEQMRTAASETAPLEGEPPNAMSAYMKRWRRGRF